MYLFKSIYVRTASVFCSCSLVMALVKEIRCAKTVFGECIQEPSFLVSKVSSSIILPQKKQTVESRFDLAAAETP